MALSLVADENVEGHLAYLLDRIAAGNYGEYWELLGVGVRTLADLGLGRKAPDVDVWRACQRESAVLVTANRNAEGDDSLEATIRREGTLDSLPVLTLTEPRRVLHSAEYADRVIVRLIEVIEEIDRYRGSGRLYLP